MFHYRFLLPLNGAFKPSKLQCVSVSFNRFQEPAERRILLQTVHKRLQPVANRKISMVLPSRCSCAIALLVMVEKVEVQTDSPQHARKRNSDRPHLCSLSTAKPTTRMGQVIWAWTEIRAALANGMRPREVWDAAKLDGLDIPYPQFRVYVSRLRRRQRQESSMAQPRPARIHDTVESQERLVHDPFKNIREQREKKKQTSFEYDPFSINKTLID
jgi:hypothetical protein